MKSCADLEERPGTSVDIRMPVTRLRDPRQNFQQRALPSTVPADDPNRLTTLDFERKILEGPQFLRCPLRLSLPRQQISCSRHQAISQRLIPLLRVRDDVTFR